MGESFGAMTFEVDACDVVEGDADFVRKGFLIESGHEWRPASGELVHRGVEIVFIKFLRNRQAAGGSEDGAPCLIGEGKLGTGKEETGEDDRLETRGIFRGMVPKNSGRPKRVHASRRTARPP